MWLGLILSGQFIITSHESGPAPKSQLRANFSCLVPSSFVRSVLTCSSKPLLVLSVPFAQFPRGLRSFFWFSALASQSLPNSHRHSSANSGTGARVRVRTLAFFPSSSHSVFSLSTIFPRCWKELFVVLLCGLIALPPASSWSRARNCGIRGPSPFRSRCSPLGVQGLSPKLFFCVMALDVWCRSSPSGPFFFVAPRAVTQGSSFDLAACRSYGGGLTYS